MTKEASASDRRDTAYPYGGASLVDSVCLPALRAGVDAFPLARPLCTREQQHLLAQVDAGIRAIAESFDALEETCPALICREALVHAGYPDAFPHLLMTAEAARQPSVWCLSPAVCYHIYSRLAGTRLGAGVAVTARGPCFRAESSTAPGIRQVEFEMREIVFAGSRGWVEQAADDARAHVSQVARRLGLDGRWEPAEDPFFLPAARGKALMQRIKQLKLEFRSADADALALASVNRHETFFGERFGITDASGAPAHTACVAIGLDRWSARLLEHQIEPRSARTVR